MPSPWDLSMVPVVSGHSENSIAQAVGRVGEEWLLLTAAGRSELWPDFSIWTRVSYDDLEQHCTAFTIHCPQ